MATQINEKFNFYLDRGGTFTDVFCELPSKYHSKFGPYHVEKLLSVNPGHYPDAPREGIRRILEQVTGIKQPSDKPVNSSLIGTIRMGTTVATNALLERNGEPTALLITKGFRDILHIANQSRPKIFDLAIKRPEVLYKKVYEINERIRMAQFLSTEELKENEKKIVNGSTNEQIYIEQALDIEQVQNILQTIKNDGIKSIAVVFMHSYTFNKHEQMVKEMALKMGFFSNITISSDTIAMKKYVPRGQTCCADAYLTPCIKEYVEKFSKGFDDKFKQQCRVSFMQSDGGLCSMDNFNGYKAVLSGPAGGVVGYVHTTYKYFDCKQPLIGFDMGGTSTDVSRYDGEFEHVFENVTAGVCIQAPQLDIHTVAAGGGSILSFEAGMMHCGPESARAYPGPVCYLNQGPLAITDANLVLGRIIPQFFPKIFGPNKDKELGKNESIKAFAGITNEINEYNVNVNKHATDLSIEEVAMGFVNIANEAMARPIRNITMARGYDIVNHVLCCFGGAGGQHACAIARSLGIHKVFIHKFSGILSAYGMGLADVVQEKQEACSTEFKLDSMEFLQKRLAEIGNDAASKLIKEGHKASSIMLQPYLNLRFVGTNSALFIAGKSKKYSCQNDDDEKDFDAIYKKYENAFIDRYKQEYGFVLDRDILVDDIRCRATASGHAVSSHLISQRPKDKSLADSLKLKKWKAVFDVCGQGIKEMDTTVYDIADLYGGDVIKGPSLILQNTSTIVVEPQCSAEITKEGNIVITVGDAERKPVTTELNNVQLAIFGHRFMSIAEQMGRALQRTSVSTNIKERLDFSCAIFGPTGKLVANAPHIPVHLGSMQDAVKYQVDLLGDKIKDGDVLVSNHPISGGTHLPDITVITPVFSDGKAVFWLGSRGHHADIGGIAPGSMPPFSKYLSEEGCAIESFFLIKNGKFNDGIIKLLNDAGTRNLSDNLSDLRAQIAANNKGKELMKSLIDEYSLTVVQAYMNHIQANAENAVREMLKNIHEQYNEDGASKETVLSACDYMDDGTPIVVTITINENGNALFDFEGTGPMVYGNCNAPPSVTYSAIIYCMRCLVELDIPLNQGCLAPITVKIPKNTILNPSIECAVVGGNVLTSQRITDVILKAFKAAAASQGCMNNLTFGDETFGYYETIAGGSGAGKDWNGQSGVHTHMTNTRITDAEIFERRYPAVLRRFSLRENSGGKGQFDGGDGCERFIEFTKPLSVSILSERRSFEPFGMNGGGNGKMGRNIIKRKRDGAEINIGAKRTYHTESGDMIKIFSPGGGGWGKTLIQCVDDTIEFLQN